MKMRIVFGSVMPVSWGLEFLRTSVFGFRVGGRVRVRGLLLFEPHVSVEPSFSQKLLVSRKRVIKEDFIYLFIY